MLVQWTKLSDERHRFTVLREDGSRESLELDSRSFLIHDFMHFAMETECHEPPATIGLMTVEKLVGPMQSLYRGHISRELYMAQARRGGRSVVSEEWVDAVLERMRKLTGQYKALPYGETMQLEFERHSL